MVEMRRWRMLGFTNSLDLVNIYLHFTSPIRHQPHEIIVSIY
jgi:hypothetical protein